MRRRTRECRLQFECLEPRRVLAGNVNAFIANQVMTVIGDSQDNQIEISQQSFGRYVVTGVDTTVNGGNDPVIISGGIRHITVVMHDGNDEVVVLGVDSPENFTFHGGFGNDRLQTNGLTAYHFHAEGQAGDDVFDLTQNIDQSTYLYLGIGNDVVFADRVVSGRNFKIFGHGGNDTIASQSLDVGRKLELHLHDGNDSVLMEGHVRAGMYAMISTDAGNDFVGILPSRMNASGNFGSQLSVFVGEGNDNVALDSGVMRTGYFRADGGPDIDAIQRGGANIGPNFVNNFESGAVNNLDNLINDVLDRLQEVGIGEEEIVVPLEADASDSQLNVAEDADPTAVDAGFLLQGSEPVTGATIEIVDYAAGQEELSFTSTTSIIGVFNAVTGAMTLSGTASTASYQDAIRSVLYQVSDSTGITDVRQFNFIITNDDETANASRDFQVIAINDPPLIVPGDDTVEVIDEDLPVVIDDMLTVTDSDDENLTSAVVTIVDGLEEGDVLASQDLSGITSTYDPTTGALTLTGVASVAEWEAVLRTVTFGNEGPTIPLGARLIRMTINDGTDTGSADFTVTVVEDDVMVPNSFTVSESTPNGTVIGRVVTMDDLGVPVVFQFNDDSVPEDVLLNADDHMTGISTSPVVLIEYLSYQCPACATNHPIITSLIDTFEGELIVIRRHQPLEAFFDNAIAAAVAAEAAARQGRFEEYSDELFANQSEWSPEADPTEFFEQYAENVGLNLDQFRDDVADPALEERVLRDRDEANGLGITSTPSFILQNEPLPNPGSEEAFEMAIADAIDDYSSPFTIDRETGDIVVWDNSLLDAATEPEITLVVLVMDASGTQELVTVTITVTP